MRNMRCLNGVFSMGFAFRCLMLLLMLRLTHQQVSPVNTTTDAPTTPPVNPPVLPEPEALLREAPFCIDETNKEPHEEGLYYFEEIFHFHKTNNTYVPVSDGITSPSGLITKFELKGIRVNDVDSGYSSVLHNWVHITVEAAIPIEGLYVQAIGAPWGTPFGEFVVDFDCGDCNLPTSTMKSHITIIPCVHRPAFEYTHPNVFTIGGQRQYVVRAKKKFSELHFNFRYTQYPGVEYTFAQFLIIAVRDFYIGSARWETFFSPIYRMNIDKNPTGVYHPFYLGWPAKHLTCHAVSLEGEMEVLQGVSQKYKIRYNQNFDNCVRKKEGKEWYTCPPGPFKMEENLIPTDLDSWNTLRNEYIYGSKTELSKTPGTPGNIGGVQFCPDSGTWTWGLGKANWTLPPNTKFVKNCSECIDIEAMGVNEDDLDREVTEDIDCDEYNKTPDKFTQDKEVAEICSDIGRYTCDDIHLNDCENLVDIPLPEYGKEWDGTRKKKNWDTMTFSEQFDDIAWRWGEKYVLVLHGYLLIFSVTAGFNILAFVARYMKEGKLIEPKSSYFGIGGWLWVHMFVTYLVICTASAGFFLLAHQNYRAGQSEESHVHGPRDLCNVRPTPNQTDYCLKTIGHRYLGGVCVLLFMMSYATGWKRPETKGLRNINIIYHFLCGYFSKLAGWGSILFSGTSLKESTLIYMGLLEISSIIFFVVAELLICAIDRRVSVRPKRKVCPVLEGVDLADDRSGACGKLKKWLLPIYVIIQLLFIFIAIGHHYYNLDQFNLIH